MATTRKLQYKAIKDTASTHVGSPGDIFYDPAVAELRMYDGNAGGMVIGGGGGAELYVVERSATDQTYVIPSATTPTIGKQWKVVLAPYYSGVPTGGVLRVGIGGFGPPNYYTLFGTTGVIWNTDQSYHGEYRFPSSGPAMQLVFDNRNPGSNADFCLAAQIDLVYMGDYLGLPFISINGYTTISGYTP